MTVLFDARSARSGRTSGWERYSRLLLDHLGGVVEPIGKVTPTAASRILSDWFTLPRAGLFADCVHFPTFPPARPVARRDIYTLHDLTWWKYPQYSSVLGKYYYRELADRALRKCHIVTVSEAMRREVLEYFDIEEQRVTSVPLGVVPLPYPEYPEQREKPYMLAVGTIEPRKNFSRLVDAYVRAGLSDDYELVVVGRRGWTEVPQGVTWLGPVSDRRLSALYAGARALFSPSLYEGFGLPVLEGLAAGAAVYCSDLGAHREVAGPYATYFDPGSVEAIVEAIVHSARAERQQPSKGRDVWISQFTWKRTAAETSRIYKFVAGSA